MFLGPVVYSPQYFSRGGSPHTEQTSCLILDPRSNSPIDRVVVATGSGLKFYNLHQTLNTSINALNSFTDIYLISSARPGFVFFISFTNFFLIVIVPLYPTLLYLSSLVLGACCLVKSRVSL